jgi:hypothetical protein
MGLVIAAGEGDSHDSSSVTLWDSYIVAFVIPMMQFQSDLKECVEFRGIFHLQFLCLCKELGFRVCLGFRVLCQGFFFYRIFISYAQKPGWNFLVYWKGKLQSVISPNAERRHFPFRGQRISFAKCPHQFLFTMIPSGSQEGYSPGIIIF